MLYRLLLGFRSLPAIFSSFFRFSRTNRASAHTHTPRAPLLQASGKVGAAGAPAAAQAEAVAGASRCSAEGPLRGQERTCFRSTARGVDAKESEGDPGLGTVSLRRLATRRGKKKKCSCIASVAAIEV